MVEAVIVTLSDWTSSSSEIMPLNSPGGSILQWGVGRHLLCLAALVIDYIDDSHCLVMLFSELLAAKDKHGLKAEAMRELGNVQYSVRNVRFVDDILLFLFHCQAEIAAE